MKPLCKCGCGTQLIKNRAGTYNTYILGHNKKRIEGKSAKTQTKKWYEKHEKFIGFSYGTFTLEKRVFDYKYMWKCSCGNIVIKPISDIKNGYKCIECIKYEDLTGRMFFYLKVKKIATKTTLGRSWECECIKCNTHVVINEALLLSGKKQSCGCSRLVDQTGRKSKMLTVIKRAENSHKWECLCSCGNTVLRNITASRKMPISCGCHRDTPYLGNKFGGLTVLKSTKGKNRQRMWECVCNCGNIVLRSSNQLKKAKINNYRCSGIGCYRTDYIGKQVGELTVIKILPREGRRVKWECLCSCGNKVARSSKALKSAIRRNKKSSCGCTFRDYTGKVFEDLTIIASLGKGNSPSNPTKWMCTCSCGESRITTYKKLRTGVITKCKKCEYEEQYLYQRFKKLEVLKIIVRETKTTSTALCKCHYCGNKKEVSLILIGKQKSCGCLMSRKDMIGFRSGKLTVIKKGKGKPNKKYKLYWDCICDCGNRKENIGGCVLRGNYTMSCGCLGAENVKEALKDKSELSYTQKIKKITKRNKNASVLSSKYRTTWEESKQLISDAQEIKI